MHRPQLTVRSLAAVAAVLAGSMALAPTGPAAASTAVPVSASGTGGLRTLLTPPLPGVAEMNGRLLLDGKPHYFTGINAYSATTDWSVNWGCGTMIDDLGSLFGAVPRGSLVRTWAFQALGFNNKTTHATDFTAIDRVVQAAHRHGDYLVLALSDQAGTCDDGHFHNAAWYAGGYTRTYNDSGRGLALSMSYLQWVKAVVRHFRGDRTVAIYEPVNEPEASNCDTGYRGRTCFSHNWCPPDATTLLRAFFDRIGGVIKSLDPAALVSTGTLGGQQCGVAGGGFATINASPAVDVTTLHDYGSPTVASTAELVQRSAQAAALGKVFVVEESGIDASGSGVGCLSLAGRAMAFRAKSLAAKRAGADGYLPWNFSAAPSSACSSDIAAADPSLLSLSSR